MSYKQCSGGARSNKPFQSTRHQTITSTLSARDEAYKNIYCQLT